MTDEPLELDGSQVCWIDPAYDAPDSRDTPSRLEATTQLFTTERQRLAAQGLVMIRRETWGAVRSYTDVRAVTMPARRFFLHVAVIGSGGSFYSRMRTIEKIGISRFPNTGISYNTAVDFDGTLAEAQPLARRGAHTVVTYAPNKMGLPDGHNANYDSRALVLPQNCPDRVTDAQIDSAARWAAAQIRAGYAVPGAKWFGHRDAAPKSCPCDTGYRRIPELQRLTDHYAAVGLRPKQPEEWIVATEADLRKVVAEELAPLKTLYGPRLACVQVTGNASQYLVGPGLVYGLPSMAVLNALRKAHIAHDTTTQITQAELDALKASAVAIGKLGAPDLTGLAAKLDALAARPAGDVDEAVLAQALLDKGLAGLSDEDVIRISVEVNNEQSRRGVA